MSRFEKQFHIYIHFLLESIIYLAFFVCDILQSGKGQQIMDSTQQCDSSVQIWQDET